MKRRFRAAVLLLVLTVLLTTVVFADSGPKPQMAVRVVHAPQEAYYLDLLDEGTYTGAYETDETGLDPALLQAFRAAIPSGWHGCISQGSTRAPIWGDLTGQAGENGEMLHTFRYVGVPQTYRILMVTQSGEVFLSDVLQRDTLQSIVTVDWAAKTVEPQPVYRGYVLQFLATFVPTLVIEFLVLLLFGFSLRENWKTVLLVNFLIGYLLLRVVTLIESSVYARTLRGRSKRRAVLYAICANVCSAALGYVLAEPVWHLAASLL